MKHFPSSEVLRETERNKTYSQDLTLSHFSHKKLNLKFSNWIVYIKVYRECLSQLHAKPPKKEAQKRSSYAILLKITNCFVVVAAKIVLWAELYDHGCFFRYLLLCFLQWNSYLNLLLNFMWIFLYHCNLLSFSFIKWYNSLRTTRLLWKSVQG